MCPSAFLQGTQLTSFFFLDLVYIYKDELFNPFTLTVVLKDCICSSIYSLADRPLNVKGFLNNNADSYFTKIFP